MGHGGGAAAGGGMSSKQQQAALEAFRQPGRQLLVSTAAGEEGIDVPRCELVVRYAATQTGEECSRTSAVWQLDPGCDSLVSGN